MKKLFFALLVLLCLVSCDNLNTDEPTTPVTPETTPGTTTTPTIYLAGDSTVKTYEDNQYIAGWGQYLDLFLDSSITVVNCAQGGRSSRSFINEGRLFDIENNNYSFTQNNGNSIGDVIAEGDYLFIQFGHNDDDTKKASSYSSLYDRMVPLGTADANGIYPTTAGTKVETTYLPEEYTSNVSSTSSALTEIAKYGPLYYAYDSGGTYKWFLKQYIDFARAKNAIPVLVTPVARVKFEGNEIIGGPGLHGENFAYVQAVRQLAEEEDCLLIDLFADTKTLLETSTSSYANYLMALKPNDLAGEWPAGYDAAYGNSSLGYTGVEATHYNKYGAYLSAAKVIETILSESSKYTFTSHITTTPEVYIDPSNLMPKTTVQTVEALFTKCTVTNPNRSYSNPSDVIAKIDAIASNGTVTVDNYLAIKTLCEEARALYSGLNIDDRSSVTNLSTLASYEADVKAIEDSLRPEPTSRVLINFDDLAVQDFTTTLEASNCKIVAATGKACKIMASASSFTYSGDTYATTNVLSLGGSATFGTSRYIEFTVTDNCTITIAAKSTGSTDRILNLVNSTNTATVLSSFDAKSSLSVTTAEIAEAGTYYLGSAGSGIYVYEIIIEYFD